MVSASLLAVMLAAEPSLASPDFNLLNVKEEVGRFCNEHLAQQLAARGLQVTTARQMSALLGLERQKQLLGCAENSCMAELSAALGVDGVVLGDLGRLGSKFQVSLRVVRSTNGQVLATWSRTVDSEDQLLDAYREAAEALAPKVFAVLRPNGSPPPPSLVASPPSSRRWPLVPTVIGAGLGVVAVVAGVLTATSYGTLTDRTRPPGSVDGPAVATLGKVSNGVLLGAAAGAVVSFGLAVILYAVSGGAPASAWFLPAQPSAWGEAP